MEYSNLLYRRIPLHKVPTIYWILLTELPPLCNAQGVLLGQTCLADALLYFGYVVLYATRLPGLRFAIIDGISGARVAIARLANRAGVQDQPRLQSHALSHFD